MRIPTHEEARGARDVLALLAPRLRVALEQGVAGSWETDMLSDALGVDLDAGHVPPHVAAALDWAEGR